MMDDALGSPCIQHFIFSFNTDYDYTKTRNRAARGSNWKEDASGAAH